MAGAEVACRFGLFFPDAHQARVGSRIGRSRASTRKLPSWMGSKIMQFARERERVLSRRHARPLVRAGRSVFGWVLNPLKLRLASELLATRLARERMQTVMIGRPGLEASGLVNSVHSWWLPETRRERRSLVCSSLRRTLCIRQMLPYSDFVCRNPRQKRRPFLPNLDTGPPHRLKIEKALCLEVR
jgi:hypothetical protein